MTDKPLRDPELRNLVLTDMRVQGASEEIINAIEGLLDRGEIVPVKFPDGSYGMALT